MKKYFWLLSILIFSLTFCKQKTIVKEGKKELVVEKIRPLNDNLEKHVLAFIHEYIKSDTSLKGITFSIEFFNEEKFSLFHKGDTLVLISPLSYNDKVEGVKGVVVLDSIFLIIADKDDVGNYYYSDSLLLDIPIDSLKCTNRDTLGSHALLVKAGKLYEWGP